MGDPEYGGDINILRLCGVLELHFFCGLVLILLGVFTIVTRFVDKLRPWHTTVGSIWVYGVIMQIATSLYIRNDGFKSFIFSFLIILTVFMITGHASIRFYQKQKARKQLLSASTFGDPGIEMSTANSKVATTGDNGSDSADFQQDGTGPTDSQVVLCGQIFELKTFRTIHIVSMIISYSMLFGAGAMFTRRAKDIFNCTNIYMEDDMFKVGSYVFETDEGLWLGQNEAGYQAGEL